MESKWGRLNIVHAVFVCLALGCGITYSALSGTTLKFIYEKFGLASNSAANVTTTLVWMIGFAWIVPAVIGLIAAFLKKRGLYIAHMILSFIAVGILGYLFFRGLARVGTSWGSRGTCSMDSSGKCTCENGVLESLLDYFTCDEVNRLVRTGYATDAMFFGGGVVTVIAAICSIVLSRNVQQTSQAQPATVMVNTASPYPYVQTTQYPYAGQGIQYSGQGIQYSGYNEGSQYPGYDQGPQYSYQPQASEYPTKKSSTAM